MYNLNIFVIALVTFISVNASPVSFLTKCKDGDTRCITAAAQATIPHFGNGIPEYKVKNHNRLMQSSVDASVGDLKLIVTDNVITGLEKCKAKEVSLNGLKAKVHLICNIALKGNYVAGGRLSVLPIEGKGLLIASFKDLVIDVDGDIVVTDGSDGKKHWSVKRYTPKFEFKGKTDIELTNLFDGNELLAGAIRDLLKSSGKEIATEVAPPIINAAVKEIVKNVNHFFRAVPIEDLQLN